jgi:hypothetical protein
MVLLLVLVLNTLMYVSPDIFFYVKLLLTICLQYPLFYVGYDPIEHVYFICLSIFMCHSTLLLCSVMHPGIARALG